MHVLREVSVIWYTSAADVYQTTDTLACSTCMQHSMHVLCAVDDIAAGIHTWQPIQPIAKYRTLIHHYSAEALSDFSRSVYRPEARSEKAATHSSRDRPLLLATR